MHSTPDTSTAAAQTPQIRFYRADKSMPLDSFLREQLALCDQKMKKLRTLGAIYLNQKRALHNRRLHTGDVLRIHHQPRRFPAAQRDWAQAIVDESDDYLIVDKPAGVPSHASVDNLLENALHQLETLRQQRLWLPARLDLNTSGLLILCKTPSFRRRIEELWRHNAVDKRYRAWVCGPQAPPLGLWQAWMPNAQRSPRHVHHRRQGLKCQLVVSEAQREEKHIRRCEIDLWSGRTHQIRVQLAHQGWPLLGDQLYGSPYDTCGDPSPLPLGQQHSAPIALICRQLRLKALGLQWTSHFAQRKELLEP